MLLKSEESPSGSRQSADSSSRLLAKRKLSVLEFYFIFGRRAYNSLATLAVRLIFRSIRFISLSLFKFSAARQVESFAPLFTYLIVNFTTVLHCFSLETKRETRRNLRKNEQESQSEIKLSSVSENMENTPVWRIFTLKIAGLPSFQTLL